MNNPLSSQDHNNLVNVLGYSAHSEHNTFALAKIVGATSPSILGGHPSTNNDRTALDHKYRSLVRQLPSKEHIDSLVQRFFSDLNWHYDIIDEIAFRQQLEKWRCIPYSAHTNATGVLPAEVIVFPCLLFQVMAHALLHQPASEGAGAHLESLKFSSEMNFVDLAHEYSDAACPILETVGKREITLVAIQSGVLRASLLKNTGNVIEAWHVLGAVIRDSQEIGLHAQPFSGNESLSNDNDAQWDQEMKRRIWFVLHNWDIHMAVVLGRPMTTIEAGGVAPVLPDDLVRRDDGTPPRQRTDQDPPTPSSLIRIGYDVAYRCFPQVHQIENNGGRTEDYNLVQDTHAAIVQNMCRIPLWCRDENPDTRFDELPTCHWLPAARQAMMSGVYFVLLALHRPYIFSAAESRMESLKAAQKVLTAQRRLFDQSPPEKHISFNMVYPLFDAMVISLAILVLFPEKNLDVLADLSQNVRWGMDILSEISEHNAMAQSAHGVVKKLFSCLEQSGARTSLQSDEPRERGLENSGFEMACLGSAQTGMNRNTAAGNVGTDSSPSTRHETHSKVSDGSDLSVEALWPPQPIHDLFYQDVHAQFAQDPNLSQDSIMDNVELDGLYPDNSFWSLISSFSGS